MPLAVHLDEVRPDLAADLPDIVSFQRFADAVALTDFDRTGVKIEMQAEIPSGWVADGRGRSVLIPRGCGGVAWRALSAACQQGESEEKMADGFHGTKITIVHDPVKPVGWWTEAVIQEGGVICIKIAIIIKSLSKKC